MRISKKIFFTDTNLFLQCKQLTDLDWSMISNGSDILLMISRPVQKEIDSLKSDGNRRRAKRAREASSFMKKMILSGDKISIIRESDPCVEVSFPEYHSGKNAKPAILDLNRSDDQIISEALLYQEENPNYDVELLTHDTNQILTAKNCGLPFTVVPDDWLLPPEQDPRDKRISELEKQLKKYEESLPTINITAQGKEDNDIDTLDFNITIYSELSDAEIEKLANAVFQNHPLRTKFDRDSQIEPPELSPVEGVYREWVYRPPDNEEIEQYTNVKYPEWQAKVKKFFKRLAYKKGYPNRNAKITITIDNIGGKPAENLIVEFEALGGILFQPPDYNSAREEIIEEIGLPLPLPPKPPEGNWIKRYKPTSMPSSMLLQDLNPSIPELISRNMFPDPLLPIRNIPTERDKNAFYWKCKRPYGRTDKWSFECSEFRHQFQQESFRIIVFVPRKNKLETGAIKCRVTANNLRDPVLKYFPVKIKYDNGDINKFANNYIDSSERFNF